MAEIRFSPEALNDLRQTKTHIAEELCNESAAINTVTSIIRHIRSLSDFSESGAPLSAVVNFETDYRYLVCGNYKAFYRIDQNTVYIIRILYARRDYMRILFDPPEMSKNGMA